MYTICMLIYKSMMRIRESLPVAKWRPCDILPKIIVAKTKEKNLSHINITFTIFSTHYVDEKNQYK